MVFLALDGVMLPLQLKGRDAHGQNTYANMDDYGVLERMSPLDIQKAFGGGDAEQGQFYIDLWWTVISDLQHQGVEVCILQDGRFADVKACLEKAVPSPEASRKPISRDYGPGESVEYEAVTGMTLFDLFTKHRRAPERNATDAQLAEQRLRDRDNGHIFTNDPDPSLAQFSLVPVDLAREDEEAFLRKAVFKYQLVTRLVEPKERKKRIPEGPIAAYDYNDRTEDTLWETSKWSDGSLFYIGFYERDLYGIGNENRLEVPKRYDGAASKSIRNRGTLPAAVRFVINRYDAADTEEARVALLEDKGIQKIMEKYKQTRADIDGFLKLEENQLVIPGLHKMMVPGQALQTDGVNIWASMWDLLCAVGIHDDVRFDAAIDVGNIVLSNADEAKRLGLVDPDRRVRAE